MKLFLVLFILISFSCSREKKDPGCNMLIQKAIDSVKAELLDDHIITENETNSTEDSLIVTNHILTDSIKILKDKLFLSNYKIEKVRYYLNICIRNPKQDKFLKGWIRRAVE